MSEIEHSVTVTACQNCGGPFNAHIDCPEDRDGIHIAGGAVEVVPASALEGAVERLAEAERLLSGALEPGGMGKPVRCFSRGEMADIEMALAAIGGRSG